MRLELILHSTCCLYFHPFRNSIVILNYCNQLTNERTKLIEVYHGQVFIIYFRQKLSFKICLEYSLASCSFMKNFDFFKVYRSFSYIVIINSSFCTHPIIYSRPPALIYNVLLQHQHEASLNQYSIIYLNQLLSSLRY